MRLRHQVPLYCTSLFVAARIRHNFSECVWVFCAFSFNSVSQFLLIQGWLGFLENCLWTTLYNAAIRFKFTNNYNKAKLWVCSFTCLFQECLRILLLLFLWFFCLTDYLGKKKITISQFAIWCLTDYQYCHRLRNTSAWYLTLTITGD